MGYFTRIQGSESANQTACYGMGVFSSLCEVWTVSVSSVFISAVLYSMRSQFNTSLATIDAGGLQATSEVGQAAAAVRSNSVLTGALLSY